MRSITAVIGGLFAGLGLGGGVAAIFNLVQSDDGTIPVIWAGLSLGLGVGLMVASVVHQAQVQ
jgi:hypothetical protein